MYNFLPLVVLFWLADLLFQKIYETEWMMKDSDIILLYPHVIYLFIFYVIGYYNSLLFYFFQANTLVKA